MIEEYSRSPHRVAAAATVDADPADRLLLLGCLVYGGDDLDRHALARGLLAAQPELAAANLWTAAAVGDVAAARTLLAADPTLANRRGGPHGWEPLLYVAYARIDSDGPGHDAPAVTRLLLDHGQTPTPATCGRGTTRSPPSPARWVAGRTRATSRPTDTPWRWADPDGRGTMHPLRKGLRPYDLAVRRGNRDVADILLAAGATATVLDPVDQFLAACMAGDGAAVDRLLTTRPALAAEAVTRRPEAILQAAELHRPDVVRLLAGLGFDVNVLARITPLHQAAYDGDVAVIEALLELGADAGRRDPGYDATPLGWAEHARQETAVELLRGRTGPG